MPSRSASNAEERTFGVRVFARISTDAAEYRALQGTFFLNKSRDLTGTRRATIRVSKVVIL